MLDMQSPIVPILFGTMFFLVAAWFIGLTTFYVAVRKALPHLVAGHSPASIFNVRIFFRIMKSIIVGHPEFSPYPHLRVIRIVLICVITLYFAIFGTLFFSVLFSSL